ncbi:HAMP domain-containing protein [Pseudoduganella sp. DS3]|uniref:histidine kinase n=2 Tax=Pseudoduganella guangdongensis TaxID=2692179 RepID=A0A6N9HJK1_9BURK|nr:ATP-binding protein [Pseudoduganella guangdongensis]MYN03768.1 HAMP domain-containing protein [Pseudoduganella guangdongensis]
MPRHRVFAVSDDGKELLGRITSPAMLAEAQKMLSSSDPRGVRHVSAPDGKRFMLFLPSRRHQGGMDMPDSRALLAGSGIPGLDPRAYRRPAAAAASAAAPLPAPQAGAMPPPGPEIGPGQGRAERGSPGGPPPRFRPLTPFIPIAAAVLASLLFAALLAWYFARPIRALRQAFDAAASGDLEPRFGGKPGAGGDELTTLGRDFDRMTARLRALLDGQKNLLHDVSHELRSPLARLQAAIGLAHQQPEKAAASMERIERESVRMDKLVGELLTLSRLEAGAFDAPREEFSAAELLEEILQDASFEAASSGREVEARLDGDARIMGQPELLARAIENVVRNAIKHSPQGGKVEVESSLDGAFLRVRVLDSGPGVAQEDLGKIFQPFYRSSNAAKDVDGHGLGLAIAQQVVQQHGGRIAAANRAGGGLCVELTLPLLKT